MVGQKFNRLTVIARDELDTLKPKRWLCECECGKRISVSASDLRHGRTKSCGCYKAEMLSKRRKKHGESRTKLYGVWCTMVSRCYNPTVERYDRYGGRGITVCEEWRHDYSVFREWAIANGYKDGLSIERKDNDLGYYPDNCRWATNIEQSNNTSRNRFLTCGNETHTLTEWSRLCGVSPATIHKRLKRGWSLEKALSKSG